MNTITSQFRWKNFDLNTELHVAGSFIYEGINLIDRLSQLRFEDEYFQFLYNISVGIERLEKIAYLLVAHRAGEETPSTKWKKHDHPKLYELINLHTDFLLENRERVFLKLLKDFYIEGRYDRFNYNTNISTSSKDKGLLIKFLINFLNVKPNDFFGNERIIFLPQELKNVIGEVIGCIVLPLYDLINDTASALGLYTYEIRYGAKAYKIFVEKEFSFNTEHIAEREVLIKLINSSWESDEFIEQIKHIQPLEIEQLSMDSYIGYVMNYSLYPDVKDEIIQIYEDEELESRSKQIEFIGEEFLYNDDEDNDEENYE